MHAAGHRIPVDTCAPWVSFPWPNARWLIMVKGDDGQALVWDLSQMRKLMDPILSYTAKAEINQISWSRQQTDWVAIASGNVVEALRV